MTPWNPFWYPRTPVSFEVAGLADAPELAEIHAGAFGHDWSAEEMAALLREDNVFGIVARRANLFGSKSLVGFVLIRMAADEAEVLTIAVDPRQRGRGHGRALLDAAFRQLYRDRIAAIFLEVDGGNRPAVRLYQRLGFVTVGERKGYYRDGTAAGATALVMRADLR